MELLFNIGLVALLGFLFFNTLSFDSTGISTDKIGPAGFPQMVIIIALLLVAYNTYILLKNKSDKKDVIDKKGFRVMVINIALVTAYIFTLNILGFFVGTLLFSLAAIYSMGYREHLKGILFTLILTVGITLIFGKFFYVALPRGIGILREISYFIY